ncbi:MAG: hypothetical protein Q9223_002227 [Gallowayella weberi]
MPDHDWSAAPHLTIKGIRDNQEVKDISDSYHKGYSLLYPRIEKYKEYKEALQNKLQFSWKEKNGTYTLSDAPKGSNGINNPKPPAKPEQ